jgi:hypothetical protein
MNVVAAHTTRKSSRTRLTTYPTLTRSLRLAGQAYPPSSPRRPATGVVYNRSTTQRGFQRCHTSQIR